MRPSTTQANAVAAALALAVVGLAGCGGDQRDGAATSSNAQSASSATASASPRAAADAGPKVSVLHYKNNGALTTLGPDVSYAFSSDRSSFAVVGNGFKALGNGSTVTACGVSKDVVESLWGTGDAASTAANGPYTYCSQLPIDDPTAKVVNSLLTGVIRPLASDSLYQVLYRDLHAAPNQSIGGVDSKCQTATYSLDSLPSLLCTSAKDGYVTRQTDGDKTLLEFTGSTQESAHSALSVPKGVPVVPEAP